MNDLYEIMCRNYYQAWVSEANDASHEPVGFGSGFMFLHRNHMYYITAEHVVSGANESFKLDPNKEYKANILTNRIVKEGQQRFAEQISFDIDKADGIIVYKVNNSTGAVSVDGRVDLYYRRLDEHINREFYTHGLVFPDRGVCYGGLKKVKLSLENVDLEINPNHTFSLFGMVQSHLNGFTVEGITIRHSEMSFVEKKYNQYCLSASRTDEHLIAEYWTGLSGAAVYDEVTGKVIGMALRYSEDYNYCWVLPIRDIVNFIDIDINNIK